MVSLGMPPMCFLLFKEMIRSHLGLASVSHDYLMVVRQRWLFCLVLRHCSPCCHHQLSHCVLIERTQATHAMMEQAVFLATSSTPSNRAGMKVQDEIAASDGGCCFYQVTNNEMNRVDGDLPRTSYWTAHRWKEPTCHKTLLTTLAGSLLNI